MPVVTPALVDRMLELEIANLASRQRAYVERPGNPAGVHIETFGAATAFVAERLPLRFFNSVLGVSEDTLTHLDAILAFYADHGVRPAFEIVPARMSPRLGEALFARGFAALEFHAGLARELVERDAEREVAVPVETVEPGDTESFDTFLDVYLRGWQTDDLDNVKQTLIGWADNRTWRFYLARLDGAPAGAGVLDIRGDTALLGSASTLPAARGRRVQGALLNQRIRDAARTGCDLVVGGAYCETTSLRNQQRAGLEIMFTRGIWAAPACGR